MEFSTEINGVELLSKQQLGAGDVVDVGDRRFRIVQSVKTPRPPPSPPRSPIGDDVAGDVRSRRNLWANQKPSGIPIPKSAKSVIGHKSKLPIPARKSTGQTLRKADTPGKLTKSMSKTPKTPALPTVVEAPISGIPSAKKLKTATLVQVGGIFIFCYR